MDDSWSTSGMRSVSKLLVMFVAVFIFALSNTATLVSAEESSCVSCHTSMKKLLEITRAIEASKPKVEKPTESKGEG
ncbi:hypothetical protein ES708_10482 [subsurface metagenome]